MSDTRHIETELDVNGRETLCVVEGVVEFSPADPAAGYATDGYAAQVTRIVVKSSGAFVAIDSLPRPIIDALEERFAEEAHDERAARLEDAMEARREGRRYAE